MQNRAVPVSGILPELYYRDPSAAIRWLQRAFGFELHYVVPERDGGVHTAQLRLGNAYVMIRAERDDCVTPATAGASTQTLMVIVSDVDAHHEAASRCGVQVVSAPEDHVYGEREYKAIDLDGHRWTFAQHIFDVDPLAIFEHP